MTLLRKENVASEAGKMYFSIFGAEAKHINQSLDRRAQCFSKMHHLRSVIVIKSYLAKLSLHFEKNTVTIAVVTSTYVACDAYKERRR